jgi:hypothetical protein
MCPSPSSTHHLRVPLLYNRSAPMLGVRDLEKLQAAASLVFWCAGKMLSQVSTDSPDPFYERGSHRRHESELAYPRSRIPTRVGRVLHVLRAHPRLRTRAETGRRRKERRCVPGCASGRACVRRTRRFAERSPRSTAPPRRRSVRRLTLLRPESLRALSSCRRSDGVCVVSPSA